MLPSSAVLHKTLNKLIVPKTLIPNTTSDREVKVGLEFNSINHKDPSTKLVELKPLDRVRS